MLEILLSISASVLIVAVAAAALARERTVSNGLFALAALVLALIEVSDQVLFHISSDPVPLRRVVMVLESLLPLLFLSFSLSYSRRSFSVPTSLAWKIVAVGACAFPVSAALVPLESFFYSPDLQSEKMLFLGNAGYWFYMGVMAYCILALVNVEATFVTASSSEKWKIKFEVVGIGGILAVLIFYYSQGLLYRTINMNLIPARAGILVISSLLIAYSKFFRGNNVKIAVSHYVLYRSFTILAVGLYLLALGIVGEGMRYMGVSVSRDLTVFIAFASGIGLTVILLSGRLRRKAHVLVNKHFFRHKFDYRSEWLKFSGTLALCSTLEEVNHAILATYRETFGMKGASLYLRDGSQGKYVHAASQGTASANSLELPAASGLISYFMNGGRVFNPLDGEYEPAAEEAALIRQTCARLMVPLISNEQVVGFVVLREQLAQEKLIYEDFDLMRTLGKQAAVSIVNLRLFQELAETREIAVVAKISSFVIHDLKNQMSSLSLLIDNAEEHIDNPEFQQDMLDTVRNTVHRMRNLMQKLRGIPEKSSVHAEPVDLRALAEKTVEDLRVTRPGVDMRWHGTPVVSMVDEEEVRKVILNLLLNAYDATAGRGIIEVETGYNGGMARIRVSDNGCGMSEGYVQNDLFKPFRTTKEKGLGIGLYQCKQIVEAHGGKIEVQSRVDEGTAFTVCLPLHQPEAVAGGNARDAKGRKDA
jgi:putative PEP-CTERM system histidine kinase